MKKIFIAAFAVVAMVAISSCGKKSPKASLDSDIDSLSYAIGMSQTQGLKQYLSERLGVDTAYVDEFVKGLIEGANAGDDKKQAAYYAGVQIGQQISNQMIPGITKQFFDADTTKSVSLKNFLAGFITAYKGDKGNMTIEQASEVVQQKFQAMQEQQASKQFGKNKAEGEKFMAAFLKNEGVQKTKSGIAYRVITAGTGAKATASDDVTVKYEGKLVNGEVFDSTEKHGGEPTTLNVGSVIPGWTEILQLMPVGSKWEVVIPYQMAYGAQGGGQIEPFSTLVFTIELVDIVKKAPAQK